MNKLDIIKQLVLKTYKQLLDYRNDDVFKELINNVIDQIISDKSNLELQFDKIDNIIPDSEDDGSWECSYAINAGLIILSYIKYK